MSDMAPKKTLIIIIFILLKPFFEFLNLSGNSIFELPDNGL